VCAVLILVLSACGTRVPLDEFEPQAVGPDDGLAAAPPDDHLSPLPPGAGDPASPTRRDEDALVETPPGEGVDPGVSAAPPLSAASGRSAADSRGAGAAPPATPPPGAPVAPSTVSPSSGAGEGRGGAPSDAAPPGAAPADSNGSTVAAARCPGCERSQGVTDREIKVGFIYTRGADEFYEAFGVPARFGNGERQARALVDDLNRRGGIAGRKVVPVFVTRGATNSDSENESYCAEFTEDQQVFAVFDAGGGGVPGNALVPCIARHQTLYFSGFLQSDDEYFRELAPWFLGPSLKSDTRIWHTMIPALAREGFFIDGAKVGLVVIDQPPYARVSDRVVKPLLARAGLPVTESRISSADPSSVQSQVAQAVLRFKAENVTNVLFIPGFGTPFFFMQNAETQQFRPRYGITSDMGPAPVLENTPGFPRAQLRGSLGIGWQPRLDVADARYPYTAQEQRCFKVMNDGGEQTRSRTDPGSALGFCDAFWAFEAAATRAGRSLTSGSVVAGYYSLGTAWPSVQTFQSDFTFGTPDGAYSHRLLGWDEQCMCFDYRGPVRADARY
jgi:branched-chain amino acid transport system substrate-binding protein